MWSHWSLQDPGEGREPLFPGFFRRHFLLQLLALPPPTRWLPPSSLLRGGAGGLAWVYTQPHRVTWAHTTHTVTSQSHPYSHTAAATYTTVESLLTSVVPSQAQALESPSPNSLISPYRPITL